MIPQQSANMFGVLKNITKIYRRECNQMTRVDTSAVGMPFSSRILLLLFQEAGDFDNLIIVVLMKMLLLAIADHIL